MRITSSMAGCLVAATALTLTACSSKTADDSSSSGDVKTDIGVTDDEITLAALTDLSGIFKVNGLAITQGNELWVDDVNADGGVCGRTINLNIQDMGYKVDSAVAQYATISQNDLGIIQMVGSPMLAALKSKLVADNMIAMPPAWSSVNLDVPNVVMIGATYDIEMLNGLSYAQDQGMLAPGDKIGHIYVDSEYGQNALLGSQAYAQDNDMEIVPAAVSGADTDMTATVTKLKSEGVSVIAVSTSPAAIGSIALQNVAQGLEVPLIANGPSFAPNLLTDPAVVDALTKHYYSVQNIVPFNDEHPKAQAIAGAYEEKFTDAPTMGVNHGYAEGMVWGAILEKACENGDLTRNGVLEARSQLTDVDTEGLTGELDFSKPGAPSSRENNIQQVDPGAEGGSKIVEPLFASDEAKKYKAPFEK